MITNGGRVRPLLHPHRRVTPRHAPQRDFAGALGYGWLVDTPLEQIYTAAIVDTAHLVADICLAAGDPAGAEAAARVSLLAGDTSDVALLDLVAAYDAMGDQAQAQAYVRRIMANHCAEVEEDLPPRTYEVLHRRRWLPSRGRTQAG